MTDERPAIAPSLMKLEIQLSPARSATTAIGSGTLSSVYGTTPVAMPEHEDVEHGADQSEPMMPIGMSRWGFSRLLRRRTHRVEADVREEHDGGPGHHAAPAEGALMGLPSGPTAAAEMNGCQLAGFDRVDRADDEDQHHRDFHEDDHVVDVGRLLDADHEQVR